MMKFLLTASMLHEGLNCDKLLLRCNILEGWACKWVRYHSIRSLLFRVNVTYDIWLIFHVCIRLCFWILLEGVGFLLWCVSTRYHSIKNYYHNDLNVLTSFFIIFKHAYTCFSSVTEDASRMHFITRAFTSSCSLKLASVTQSLMNWRLATAQRRSIGFKWLEYAALKISTWLFSCAFFDMICVWCILRLSRKMNVLRLYMRMRRALRNSTKSGVFIDMSLCKHATTRPSRVIAATTAMHLKPIFYLSIFNDASPAFAQYLALI